MPTRRQDATWLSAMRSTFIVSAPITSVRSASSMNPFGGTSPPRGWRQRTSASTPTISPVSTASLGW